MQSTVVSQIETYFRHLKARTALQQAFLLSRWLDRSAFIAKRQPEGADYNW